MAKKDKFVLTDSAVFQKYLNEKTKLEGIYGTETAVKKVILRINKKLNELELNNITVGQNSALLKRELEETKQYLQSVYLKTEDVVEDEKI